LISPELQAAIEAMPKAHLTYIVTAYGKPRSKVGLGNDFAKWATAAGLPKHCRMHGLKKGGMRRLAEDSATTHELMAISGHRTLSEVERYTADADRLRLADQAMAKIENKTVGRSYKHRPPRIQTVEESLVKCGFLKCRGGPERTRTSDLRFRKPLLYPAELRDHYVDVVVVRVAV
jgi:hypothetical protein